MQNISVEDMVICFERAFTLYKEIKKNVEASGILCSTIDGDYYEKKNSHNRTADVENIFH